MQRASCLSRFYYSLPFLSLPFPEIIDCRIFHSRQRSHVLHHKKYEKTATADAFTTTASVCVCVCVCE